MKTLASSPPSGFPGESVSVFGDGLGLGSLDSVSASGSVLTPLLLLLLLLALLCEGDAAGSKLLCEGDAVVSLLTLK